MSAPALAPDARLPRRDTLLDAPAMAERLSRLLGADGPVAIDRYDRGRVKYKLGDSLRVLHEVEIDGTPRLRGQPHVRRRPQRLGLRARHARRRGRRPAARGGPRPRARHRLLDLPERPQDRRPRRPRRRHGRGLAAARPPRRAHRAGRLRAREVGHGGVPRTPAGACSPTPRSTPPPTRPPTRAASTARCPRAWTAPSRCACPPRSPTTPRGPMLAVEALHGRRIDGLRGDELDRRRCAASAPHWPPCTRCPRRTACPPSRAWTPTASRSRPASWPARGPTSRRSRCAWQRISPTRPPGRRGRPPSPLHGDVHLKNGLLLRRRADRADRPRPVPAPAPPRPTSAACSPACATARSSAATPRPPATSSTRCSSGYAARRVLPAPAVLGWHVAAALLSERALRAVNRIRPRASSTSPPLLRAARASLTGAEA